MRAARDRFGQDFLRILNEYDGRTFGFASKNFYKEFLAAREIAKDTASYFPEGLVPEPPLEHESVTIDRPMSAVSVARRYGVPLAALAAINPAWTVRALRGSVPVPAGAEVWLPHGTLGRIGNAVRKPPAPVVAALGAAVHVVRKGETLFGIATDYGVSLARLLDANDLGVRSPIHPGQHLQIP
jgi:membrane-bound lytic murein transglycosylase D